MPGGFIPTTDQVGMLVGKDRSEATQRLTRRAQSGVGDAQCHRGLGQQHDRLTQPHEPGQVLGEHRRSR